MKKTILWMMLLSPCFLSIDAFADTYKGKKDYYDKRHGIWKQYYGTTDKVAKISTYRHGVLNGPQKIFHKSGKIFATTVFKDGAQHGPYVEYYDNKENSKKTQGTHTYGKQSGQKTEWHANGAIKSVSHYVKGSQEGAAEHFYSSGHKLFKTVLKYGQYHGPYVGYYDNVDNTKKIEGNHAWGHRDGKWTEWHGNGNKKSIVNYLRRKQHGPAEYFYPSGRKNYKTVFQDGKHYGPYVGYYDTVDNTKKIEGNHVLGTRDGKWTEWHVNGAVYKTSVYKHGQKNGVWEEFDETGKMLKTKTYKNGGLVKGGKK